MRSIELGQAVRSGDLDDRRSKTTQGGPLNRTQRDLLRTNCVIQLPNPARESYLEKRLILQAKGEELDLGGRWMLHKGFRRPPDSWG